jgi:hypothetical protein
MRFFALLLTACAPLGTPSPSCEALCDLRTDRFGFCLDERGERWEDAGYLTSDDYQSSCHTWAWEMGILARAWPEPKEAEEALDDFCASQKATIEEEAMDCARFLALDWETEPWLR